jgi:pimeloyl-ACP methyl ester carboxylesterase
MRAAIAAAGLGLLLAQPAGQSYVGNWTAEFGGQTFVRLELSATEGGLRGRMSVGDGISVDLQGEVDAVAVPAGEPSPLSDIVLRDGTLSFSRKEGGDVDHFQMRLAADGTADLLLLLTQEERREAARSGAVVVKPFHLKPLRSVVSSTRALTEKTYPPPGRLIDIGGWRLHLNCTGSPVRRRPTVVLEAGAGDFSIDWALVQPGVARFARVCSYDRAGAGWSDLGPRPRTWRQIAYELHTALKKSGNKGPFVLVGHSLGGLMVRVYATQYRKDVAGMVLVDSTHEDAVLGINGKLQRQREVSQGRRLPPPRTKMTPAERELSPQEKQQAEAFIKQIGPLRIGRPYNQLPAELQAARLWVMAQPKHYTADNYYMGEEFADLYAARRKQVYPLGEAPLVVLLPKPEAGSPPPGVSADEWKRLNDEKRQQKLEFAGLSRNSKVIVAPNSEHHIQLDEPAVVIDAIQQVVDAAQRRARLRP